MTKIAVLVSGGGTNLQALIDAQARGEITGGTLDFVLSSNPDAYALTRAETAGIDTAVLRRRDFADAEQYGAALHEMLSARGIGLIVLAGFMTVLPDSFCQKWQNQIINVHPSLIPSFCGAGFYGLRVHEAALKKGVKVTGATVHFVSEVVDGGAIILQKAVAVRPDDTPETLQKRVMAEAEHILLPQAVSLFCQGRLHVADGRVTIDSNVNGKGHLNMSENNILVSDSSNVVSLTEELASNEYPGRGLMLGTTPDGTTSVLVYFIMGRSENSRNRIFVETEDGIRTEAFDPSKCSDPSLIIYHPIREYNGKTIVTNGDQTDTIRDALADGMSYIDALRTCRFEPDAPNFTSRISGILNEDGSYDLSILKYFHSDPDACKRYFFEYDKPVKGRGHFLHTYLCDGDPLPFFLGEPKCVFVEDTPIDAFADTVWEALNAENKISLFVRYLNMRTGEKQTVIKNKLQK